MLNTLRRPETYAVKTSRHPEERVEKTSRHPEEHVEKTSRHPEERSDVRISQKSLLLGDLYGLHISSLHMEPCFAGFSPVRKSALLIRRTLTVATLLTMTRVLDCFGKKRLAMTKRITPLLAMTGVTHA
ncbi:MAG: hypothetical protein ACI9CF_000729 [Candidatus Omnitrophota bacterium]|jgi:hypothetical protein